MGVELAEASGEGLMVGTDTPRARLGKAIFKIKKTNKNKEISFRMEVG